jgi:hypothetical protein
MDQAVLLTMYSVISVTLLGRRPRSEREDATDDGHEDSVDRFGWLVVGDDHAAEKVEGPDSGDDADDQRSGPRSRSLTCP